MTAIYTYEGKAFLRAGAEKLAESRLVWTLGENGLLEDFNESCGWEIRNILASGSEDALSRLHERYVQWWAETIQAWIATNMVVTELEV